MSNGCCTSCKGTGGDHSGPCWDCKATGCAHPLPLCGTSAVNSFTKTDYLKQLMTDSVLTNLLNTKMDAYIEDAITKGAIEYEVVSDHPPYANNIKITGAMKPPTPAQDAVTKKYVDSLPIPDHLLESAKYWDGITFTYKPIDPNVPWDDANADPVKDMKHWLKVFKDKYHSEYVAMPVLQQPQNYVTFGTHDADFTYDMKTLSTDKEHRADEESGQWD